MKCLTILAVIVGSIAAWAAVEAGSKRTPAPPSKLEIAGPAGVIILDATGELPGIWIQRDRRSNAAVALFVDQRNNPVVGLYGEKFPTKGCPVALSIHQNAGQVQVIDAKGNLKFLR